MSSYDRVRQKALIAKAAKLAPHPAGDKPFQEKFAVGDKVVLKNGKVTIITGTTKYGDYTVADFPGGFPSKVLKRAPP